MTGHLLIVEYIQISIQMAHPFDFFSEGKNISPFFPFLKFQHDGWSLRGNLLTICHKHLNKK